MTATSGTTPGTTPPRFALLITVLGGLSLLGPFGTDTFLPALPAMAAEFAVPADRVQLTLSAFTLGMAAGQLILGPISDRIGRRLLLILGPAAAAAASIGAALTTSLPVLIAACAAIGVSAAAGMVVGRAAAADVTDPLTAPRVFSLLGMVTSVGPVLGPLGGALALALWGWRGIFAALAVFAAILAAAVWLTVPETMTPRPAGRRTHLLRDVAQVVRAEGYLPNAAVVWFGFGAVFAYISASPFLFQQTLGLSAGAFALVFAVGGISLIGVSLLTALTAARVAPQRLVATGLTVMCVGAAVIAAGAVLSLTVASAWLWMSAAGMLLLNASMGLVFGPATALAVARNRPRAGTAMALIGCVQFVAAAIAAPLAGEGAASFAVVVCTCATLAAISFLIGRRSSRRPAAAGDTHDGAVS